MRNSYPENISEHSLEVGMLAHVLTLIGNKKCGKNLNAERAALIGMYHDCTEIITGDMPTPIKYFNEHIRSAYKDLEKLSCKKLVEKVPEKLKEAYAEFVFPDESSIEYKLMKCADRFSAYIKCVEEVKSGNREFVKAKESIRADIDGMKEKSCVFFRENILPSFEKTLDELDRK